MSQRYKVTGSVTDGTFYTGEISTGFQSGVFVIAFYDANGDAVTPTAGTITPAMSPLLGQWHAPSGGDLVINAADCKKESDGLSPYNMPVFVAQAIQAKFTLDGVIGADNFVAEFWRVG